MRPIKFRAWDVVEHKYYKNVQNSENCETNRFWSFNQVLEEVDKWHLVLEEFTGMKDDNGNEIYEGDILATSSRIGRELLTDYLKVDWREDYAGFFCGEKPLYACLSEWDNDIKYPQTFPEIVGNVHKDGYLIDG